jgi:DNA-binding XRE family transcriptional regulator
MMFVCTPRKGCQVFGKDSPEYKKLMAEHEAKLLPDNLKKLRELRRAVGFSLRKFAVKIDVTPTYLSKIEQGYVIPTDGLIATICSVLNVKKEDLIK